MSLVGQVQTNAPQQTAPPFDPPTSGKPRQPGSLATGPAIGSPDQRGRSRSLSLSLFGALGKFVIIGRDPNHHLARNSVLHILGECPHLFGAETPMWRIVDRFSDIVRTPPLFPRSRLLAGSLGQRFDRRGDASGAILRSKAIAVLTLFWQW